MRWTHDNTVVLKWSVKVKFASTFIAINVCLNMPNEIKIWFECDIYIYSHFSTLLLLTFAQTAEIKVRWNHSISTSNHMFGRVNWDKLPKWIFENFEIVRVKQGQFQYF